MKSVGGAEVIRDRNSVLYSETDHGNPLSSCMRLQCASQGLLKPGSAQQSQKSFSEHDDSIDSLTQTPNEVIQEAKESPLPSKLLFSLFPSLKSVEEQSKTAPKSRLVNLYMCSNILATPSN